MQDISSTKQYQKTIIRKGWDVGRPGNRDETLKLPPVMTLKEGLLEARSQLTSCLLQYILSGRSGRVHKELRLSDCEVLAASKC